MEIMEITLRDGFLPYLALAHSYLRLGTARLRSRPRAQRLTIDWRRGSVERRSRSPELGGLNSASESKLRCPLTLELFCDPVSAADGHTYERVAIEEWLKTKGTSPMTQEPLQSKTLIPQHTMKKLVCAFMDTRRRSSVDDDDNGPPAPAPRPAPSYADMLRADEWPSLGS